MKDYYQLLGVKRTASAAEIKLAYRKLSKKFHPDVNQGDKFFEELFKDIQSAYEVLGNENKRALYDAQVGQVPNTAQQSTTYYKADDPAASSKTENRKQAEQPSSTSRGSKSKSSTYTWGVILFVFVGGFFHAVFKKQRENLDVKAEQSYEYLDTSTIDTLLETMPPALEKEGLTALLATFEGVWSGNAYQYDVQETWNVKLVCKKGQFSVKYPSLGCSGELELSGNSTYSITLRETLTSGVGTCYDNGVITLSIEEDGSMKALFKSPDNSTVIAMGHLKKGR